MVLNYAKVACWRKWKVRYICYYIHYICIMGNKAIRKQESYLYSTAVDIVSLALGNREPTPTYHYHDCYQLCLVKKGSAEIMINDMLITVSENSALFFGSNLAHGVVRCSEDTAGSFIHISHDLFPWKMQDVPDFHKLFCFLKGSQSGYVFTSTDLMADLQPLVEKLEKSEHLLRISFLLQILHRLCEEDKKELLINKDTINSPILPYAGNTALERTQIYIGQHYHEKIALEEIAAHANLNASALCRSFKKKYGYTIFQYMNRLRIEQACRLLRYSDLSITQIAYQVGYNSFSHFSQQFKLHLKIPALAYRNQTI